MIIAIGIDLTEKYRIKNLINKYKKKYIIKLFAKNKDKILEKKYIENNAKMFTIKESLVKALGTGFRKKINLKNIKIKKNNLGKPFIKTNYYNTFITISHDKNITICMLVIIKS